MHTGFPSVPKLVTLNDLERRTAAILCYLTKIGSFEANDVSV